MLYLWVVALGGAIGSVLRYICSGAVHRLLGAGFPWGTLSVNLAGSAVIGFLWAAFERSTVHPATRTFIMIGILGGFTTFSSFSLENLNLMRDGQFKVAIINIVASNVFGIALAFLGYKSFEYLYQ
ncbi:MAG: hypothetical protein A2178_02655 [Planctomycetes bacterium GWC2_49_10]|nr:MAG: hypothetical protein A2178_02655 [Planctomycetes bacterium GWC2_49_10]